MMLSTRQGARYVISYLVLVYLFFGIVDALELLFCGFLDVFAQRCHPVGMVFQG